MKYFINFTSYNLDGFANEGGMINYDNSGFATSEEFAMQFDSREEAENWIKSEQAKKWIEHQNGNFSIFGMITGEEIKANVAKIIKENDLMPEDFDRFSVLTDNAEWRKDYDSFGDMCEADLEQYFDNYFLEN